MAVRTRTQKSLLRLTLERLDDMVTLDESERILVTEQVVKIDDPSGLAVHDAVRGVVSLQCDALLLAWW